MSPGKNRKPLVWAEVNLNHLRHNLRQIRRAAKKSGAQILAIVKADAYGHGMKMAAKALEREGVSFFGVANIDEALELRKLCPKAGILVLGSFHKDQVSAYVRKRILPTVSSLEDAKVLQNFLAKTRIHFPVHLKVDTGMGRLGVWHEESEKLFRGILKCKNIRVDGVFTHFASADHSDKTSTRKQIRIFERVIREVGRFGISPRYFHAANSLGLLRFKKSHLNLVRPGIILYGLNPLGSGRLPMKLKPVLSLKTRISFLKEFGPGRTVSYGATYRVPQRTRIAVLPIGYSHGYRVGFSNKSRVLVNGQRCPVVGRVTMDQTLVDVGQTARIKRWDPVTLIGREGKNNVTAEELAKIAETIPYEIVCSIHSRIPRIYKGLK